jgi:hypothetical protein
MAVDSYVTNDSFENSSGNVNFSFNASTGEFDIVSDKLITKTIQIPDDTFYDIAANENLEKYDVFILEGSTPFQQTGNFEVDVSNTSITEKSFLFVNKTGETARVLIEFNQFIGGTRMTLSNNTSGTVSIDESNNRYFQKDANEFVVEVTNDDLPIWEPESLPSGDVQVHVTADFNTDDTEGEFQNDIGTIVADLREISSSEEGKQIEFKNASENAIMFTYSGIGDLDVQPTTIPPKSNLTLKNKGGELVPVDGPYFPGTLNIIGDTSDIGATAFRSAKLEKYLYTADSGELAIYDLDTEERVYTATTEWNASGIEKLSIIKNDILYGSNGINVDLHRIDLSDRNPSTGLADGELLIDFNDITNTSAIHVNATVNQDNEEIVYLFDEINILIKYNHATGNITETDIGFDQSSTSNDYEQLDRVFLDGRKLYGYAEPDTQFGQDGFFFEYDTVTDTKTYSYDIPTKFYEGLSEKRSEFKNKKHFSPGRIIDPFKRIERKILPKKYEGLLLRSYYDGYNYYDTSKGGVGYLQKEGSNSVYPFHFVTEIGQVIADFLFVGTHKGSFIFTDGNKIFKLDTRIP